MTPIPPSFLTALNFTPLAALNAAEEPEGTLSSLENFIRLSWSREQDFPRPIEAIVETLAVCDNVEPDLFRQAYDREAWQKRLGVADLEDAAKFATALRPARRLWQSLSGSPPSPEGRLGRTLQHRHPKR